MQPCLSRRDLVRAGASLWAWPCLSGRGPVAILLCLLPNPGGLLALDLCYLETAVKLMLLPHLTEPLE